jgi:hypothetical protein
LAVAALSAIEFLIADDHSRGFLFSQENVAGFLNYRSLSNGAPKPGLIVMSRTVNGPG